MGSDGRPAGRSSAAFPPTGSGVFSSAAGTGGWPRGEAGATSGAGEVSTAATGRPAGAGGPASGSAYSSGTSWPKIRRSLMATSSSIELEWVFFSVTPNSVSRSRISCALTSNSRASSFIRILFIDTKLSRRDAPHSFGKPWSSDSPCETRPESIMVSDSPVISMSCGSASCGSAVSTSASAAASGAASGAAS
jgi:hypothetical protein